ATLFAGEPTWDDYTITLKARKISGKEGFLISFHSTDPRQHNWWNVGGWGNTVTGFEAADLSDARVNQTIETGKWYDVKIELKGPAVRCSLDGKVVQDEVSATPKLFCV